MKEKNIVLIGLPGSGKTTVGQLLSERTGRTLLDTDEMVVESEGCSITELFSQKGEGYFRDAESRCALEASRTGGRVIATGGGIVLHRENMDALKEKGVVFFLDRPVDVIASQVDSGSRPLLREDVSALFRLHEQRDPLYRTYADAVICADTPEETAQQILLFYERVQRKENGKC